MLGGYRLPRKLICLAVCTFSWCISDFAVVPISLAATPPRTLFLPAGSQGNLISLALFLADFAWRPAAKDHFLGGFAIFLGGFWPPRQFRFWCSVGPSTSSLVKLITGIEPEHCQWALPPKHEPPPGFNFSVKFRRNFGFFCFR